MIAVNYFGRFTSNIEREQPKRPIAISKASAQQWLDEQEENLSTLCKDFVKKQHHYLHVFYFAAKWCERIIE